MSTSNDSKSIENNSSLMNVDTQFNQSIQENIGLDRFSMFNILIKNAVEQIASGVGEDTYVDMFGKLSCLRKSKSAPVRLQKKMKTNIEESLNRELNEMVEEERVKEKLQKLDKLADKFAFDDGKQLWRPNGNVDDHMRSHFMRAKLKFKSELEENVREREQRSEKLHQEVSFGRTQMREIESRLKKLQELDCSVLNEIDKKILNSVSSESQ